MNDAFLRLVRSVANSRFLMISALLHVLIVLLFGGTVLFNKYVEPPDFQAEGGDFLTPADTSAAPAPEESQTMPSMSVVAPTISAPTASLSALTSINPSAVAFSVPVAPSVAPTISTNLAEKLAGGPSASSAKTGAASQLPGTMAGRGSGKRAATLAQNGGKITSEQAVMNALRWLQKTQNPDGTWGSKFKGAMTGLALLCYLGHGETPASSRDFSVVVDKAINALVGAGVKAQGHLMFKGNVFLYSSDVYEHAIAAYALGEAYTMTHDEKIAPVLTQAIDYIVKGQRADGGWYYRYDTGPERPDEKGKGFVQSDTSVSGWQIQALKAAHLTGLPFDGINGVLDNAMRNLDRVFTPKDSSYGYRKSGDHPPTLTGVGVLCKLFWQGKPDKMVRDSLKALEGVNVKYGSPDAHLYAWYYDTQACFLAQGGSWDRWNRMFQDEIVTHQSPDGSWPPTGGRENGAGMNDAANADGLVYRTTLCALMLEVYYRYLPTGKDSAAGPAKPSNL
ncbi:MAG: hypothetical protein QOD99_2594 [Chthoniobacter sp.]|jgi:hypothetical protein|nr:hypothetical protein [Chthoniobacter sp.]